LEELAASIFRADILKMEAAASPETLVPVYHTRLYHFPEDFSLKVVILTDIPFYSIQQPRLNMYHLNTKY
jgi:hypothetical protein